MTETIIYIAGEVIDLTAGTVVATTFQLWNVGDLKVRNTTFTNRLRIPKTENNILIYGNAQTIKSQTLVPYRKQTCVVVQNGVQIIPDGTAILSETEDYFGINIYSGTFDFFEIIKDQFLNALDYSAFDAVGIWSKAVADGWRNTTSGIIAPVIQYGVNLRDAAGTIFNTLTVGGIEYSLPSFYYHTILDKIITEAGYTYSGSIFSDTKFTKIIIPAGNKTNPGNYSAAYYDARNMAANAVGGQVIVNPPASPAAGEKIEFTNVSFNGSKGYYNGVDTYQRDGSQNDNFMTEVYVWLDITVTGAGGSVTILLFNGSGGGGDLIVNNGGTGIHELTINIASSVIGLNELYVGVREGLNPATCTINGGVFRIKTSGSPFTQYGITWTNDNIQIYSEVLPEMKKTEFMKDFLIRFGQLVKEKNGVLYFKGIDEIIADKANAVDWTHKRDKSEEDKNLFTITGLGQSNVYKYKITDEKLTDDYTGRGEFLVDNDTIQELTEYTSPFSSSQTGGNDVGIMSAIVEVWEDTAESDYDNDPGFRLLSVRDKISTEPNVTWDSVPRSDYKVAYFEDPRFSSNSYQNFLDTYYPKYIASIQKLKITQRFYRLNEIDILELDLFKLIYDDGDYFIIRKANNFVAGQSTKVEIFKVI